MGPSRYIHSWQKPGTTEVLLSRHFIMTQKQMEKRNTGETLVVIGLILNLQFAFLKHLGIIRGSEQGLLYYISGMLVVIGTIITAIGLLKMWKKHKMRSS
jgi:hypothetical protein